MHVPSNPVTLPGTLPGLLQPGSRVFYQGAYGVIVAANPGATQRPLFCRILGGKQRLDLPELSEVELDLGVPDGWDRAVRWLGERLGLPEGRNGPRWHASGYDYILEADRDITVTATWVCFYPSFNQSIEADFTGKNLMLQIPGLKASTNSYQSAVTGLRTICLAMADQPPYYTRFLEESRRLHESV